MLSPLPGISPRCQPLVTVPYSDFRLREQDGAEVGSWYATLMELCLSLLSRDSPGQEVTPLLAGSLRSPLSFIICQEVSRAVTGRARALAQQGRWEGFLVQGLAGIWVEKKLQFSTALKVRQKLGSCLSLSRSSSNPGVRPGEPWVRTGEPPGLVTPVLPSPI